MPVKFAVFADILEVDALGVTDKKKRDLALVRALNKIARDGRAQAAKLIRQDINVPAAFVSPGGNRFYVSKQATRGDLEARITARGRATSLAQFVRGKPETRKEGVWIEVQPGHPTFLKKAFLIKLPQGNKAVTDTQFNLGLAVRLKPGDTLKNKLTARRVASGLYVLYGPSVSQVFRANDDSGVAEDMIPDLQDKLAAELERLLGLDL